MHTCKCDVIAPSLRRTSLPRLLTLCYWYSAGVSFSGWLPAEVRQGPNERVQSGWACQSSTHTDNRLGSHTLIQPTVTERKPPIKDVDEFGQIWRNVASHRLLSNGSSAVNGCRQKLKIVKYIFIIKTFLTMEKSSGICFSLEKMLLWIMLVKNVSMDWFLTNRHLLSPQDIHWWSGVDYCDVVISCLDSHSDGTHPLQSIH